MKVLITGISGFVGSNLYPYLTKQNHTVCGVSRKKTPNNKIYSYKECDTILFNRQEVIIHLAGKAHDLKKTAKEAEYYKTNTDLTISLYDSFLKSNAKVFVFLSTVKAVADKTESIITENTIPNPKTAYGKSKLKAENYIKSKKLPEGKKVYILRPCMIHGPNNKGNLNLLYSLINKGVPYPLGAYKNTRSFLSVQNLCFIIQNLIIKLPESGVYNVADTQPISTNKLVKIIGQETKTKERILEIPKPIIMLFAKIGDVLRLPIDSEKLEKLTETYQISNTKIKKALNLKLPLSTTEGIKITIKAFGKN